MKKFAKFVMLSLCLMMLFGCSSKNKIVGTWNGITTFTFNKDGTGTAGFGETVLNSFTYKIDNNKLTISYGDESYVQIDEYDFKVEDGKLYLGDGSGSWLIYEKESESGSNNVPSSKESSASDLSSDSLKDLISKIQSADDLLLGSPLYADWETFISVDGIDYYKIVLNDMHSTEDVYNFLSSVYVSSIVDEFKNSKRIIDYEGSIYANTGGIGGLGEHVKMVKATKNGDIYLVTFYYDDPYDYGIGEYDMSRTLVIENGRYVFSEKVNSIMSDFSDCEYIVE